MVQKSSHRGVHSGNTLRASNSRYSRRYHNQACIVSRVRSDFLEKLAKDGKNADNQSSAVQNIAVDVALSLNKQGRWLLPTALKRQISSNDVASAGLTVSLLERHKLKRHANCVSFHSNTGAVKRIQPRAGRYFSFQFPSADGISRRARRRERREELAKQLKDHSQKLGGKVVDVYTEQGRALESQELGEREVRYEVFYPCPASSSIAHNPKYIKRDLTTNLGDNGEHVEHGKPRKQHRRRQRRRMAVKDLEDFDFPGFRFADDEVSLNQTCWKPDSFQQVWCDETAADRADLISEESEDIVPEKEEEGELGGVQRTTEFLLGSLIEKAERLQQKLAGKSAKHRRRRRSGDNKVGQHHKDDKSHVVYLPPTEADETRDIDHAEQKQTPTPESTPLPEPTRVLIATEDVSVESLQECFGHKYLEADCRPRKFVLDVTDSVREVMVKCGVQRHIATNTDDALTFIIFTHDGFYDDGWHVYKVCLNSSLRPGLFPVLMEREGLQNLEQVTVMSAVSHAMDFVEHIMMELLNDNVIPSVSKFQTKAPCRQLTHHLAEAETYLPSVQHVFQLGSAITTVVMPTLTDLLEQEQGFCDVCYDDISPLSMDSAPATALVKCGHRVCDACWGQHVLSRLRQGFVRLTCPGYDCQVEVGVGALLSIAPLHVVSTLLQRQEEVRIGASRTEKWCPGEGCGRVLSLKLTDSQLERWQLVSLKEPAGEDDKSGDLDESEDFDESQLQQDVVCPCGTHVCFQCLAPAHWPASCQQAEQYRLDVATLVLPDRTAEVHDDNEAAAQERLRRELEKKQTMLVEGKHCPRCHTFVNKNGGCPNMTCRCGQIFCWHCAQPGYAHASCVDPEKEKALTTTLIVRHVSHNRLQKEAEEERRRQEATANRRQRVSLMERAAEHRQRRQTSQPTMAQSITALVKAATTAANKDPKLAQHIVHICTQGSCASLLPVSIASSEKTVSSAVPSTSPSQDSTTLSPPFILNTVTSFLKNCARVKQELHELAEYTLVLVKDLPDSVQRRRALRVADDLTAFCTFTQSIFEAWHVKGAGTGVGHQEAVKAVVRLSEIQQWIGSALSAHVATVKKLRATSLK